MTLEKKKYISSNFDKYLKKERRSIRKKDKEFKRRKQSQKDWYRKQKRLERREAWQKLLNTLLRRKKKKKNLSEIRYKKKIKAEKQEMRQQAIKKLINFFLFRNIKKKKVKHQEVVRFKGADDVKTARHQRRKMFRSMPFSKVGRIFSKKHNERGKVSFIDNQIRQSGGRIYKEGSHRSKQSFFKKRIRKYKKILRDVRQQYNTIGGHSAFLKRFIHSLSLFLLSFLLIFEAGQFLTALTARYFGIGSMVYYDHIQFAESTYSLLWTRLGLIVIFAVAPFFGLFVFAVTRRIFNAFRAAPGYMRLFLVWCVINGLNLFFGAYLAGVFTRSGFLYTSEWIFMSRILDVEEIILASASILILIFAGRKLSEVMLQTSLNQSPVKDVSQRPAFMLAQFVLPWIIGSILIFTSFLPSIKLYLLIMLLTPVLIILPAFLNVQNPVYNKTTFPFLRKKLYWDFLIISLGLLSLLIVRLLLAHAVFI